MFNFHNVGYVMLFCSLVYNDGKFLLILPLIQNKVAKQYGY
jgi:hypothetical protein